ncbi:hypothetical protein PRZ48_005394 [Zasmidium cellare]|uniref:Uncharacterized protein n=1 Tax=Zasmidium cellare TaxID=395010 RepID=A0ABR0ETT3_ZASCE|nr:hypothetical protein PRZ48_005394 [Zasmidium cellare]
MQNRTTYYNRANQAQAKSLSYYALFSPSHYVHVLVVSDETRYAPGLDPHTPVPDGGCTVVRTFRADTYPFPWTPYQQIMQYFFGHITPSIISRDVQAKLQSRRAHYRIPLAAARPSQLINSEIYVTDILRPEGKFFAIEMEWHEWMKMRNREMDIEDKLR